MITIFFSKAQSVVIKQIKSRYSISSKKFYRKRNSFRNLFRKKKSTLLKKAHELDKLCDVDVAVIICQNEQYYIYRFLKRKFWFSSMSQIVKMCVFCAAFVLLFTSTAIYLFLVSKFFISEYWESKRKKKSEWKRKCNWFRIQETFRIWINFIVHFICRVKL